LDTARAFVEVFDTTFPACTEMVDAYIVWLLD